MKEERKERGKVEKDSYVRRKERSEMEMRKK